MLKKKMWIYFLFLLNVSDPKQFTEAKATTLECVRIIHENNNSFGRQPRQKSKCETYGCVKAAAQIIGYIDESIDPCENFYQFANGKYINDTTDETEDDESRSFYTIVSDLVNKKVGPLLSEPLQPNEWKPFRLAKNFFKSCLNQPIIVRRGNQQLIDILDLLGGWPVIKGRSWSSRKFDLVGLIESVKGLGFDADIIFALNVGVNPKNTTNKLLQVSTSEA